MQKLLVILGLCLMTVALTSGNVAFATITKSAYAKKLAECKEEAKLRHFGVHWIKRNLWIRNCIPDAKAGLR